MLKKLRIKFIIIIMSIVFIMFMAIFCSLYLSTANSLSRETIQTMKNLAVNPPQLQMPEETSSGQSSSFLTVILSEKDEIIGVNGRLIDSSDTDLLNELVERVNASDSETGIFKEYNFRYFQISNVMGKCIVFADMSSEQAAMRSLLKTLFIIGPAALIVFLVISILLSRLIVKPVADAWNQQKQFIADASHELKTPLTVIITNTELLQSPECTESDRTHLAGNILTMSEQMRGLVESMLELARIDKTGKKEFSTVSFSDAASTEAMLFEPIYFEKNLSFDYLIEPDLKISGNETHLKQLVNILLDNAAKYTSDGGDIHLTLMQSTRHHCLLTVKDLGEPIDENDLKNLFKRFYRADKVRKMNHSYGLGLSIAQNITVTHGGRIWAESKNGYNSFFVELPTI